MDTIRFNMELNPARASMWYIGSGNVLTIPAGAVCDPTKSTYGVGEWDKPCTVLTKPMTIGVKAWLNTSGHLRIDFSPDIRFVPSLLPTAWANIVISDYQASLDPSFNVLYCRNATATCIDESKTDPSLITVRNPVTGKLTRRVKHFSGYLVGAGDDSSSNGDFNKASVGAKLPAPASPSAHPASSPSMTTASYNSSRRSGYILASGD